MLSHVTRGTRAHCQRSCHFAEVCGASRAVPLQPSESSTARRSACPRGPRERPRAAAAFAPERCAPASTTQNGIKHGPSQLVRLRGHHRQAPFGRNSENSFCLISAGNKEGSRERTFFPGGKWVKSASSGPRQPGCVSGSGSRSPKLCMSTRTRGRCLPGTIWAPSLLANWVFLFQFFISFNYS